MQKQNAQARIDELVKRIDTFMANGGGRMNVRGGEGRITETHVTACCGECADDVCNTPARTPASSERKA